MNETEKGRGKMRGVVLVDGDSRILESLCRDIPWEDYGCQVVGTACDAAEGVRIVRELKPHILLMEIRLAGGDGLSMLAELRGEYEDMQVAIISDCRDFECAREAIRLGVVRYLPKPAGPEEIGEALRAMTERLDRRQIAAEEEYPRKAGSFVVTQALYYMDKNYRQKLTLPMVAECCYVSQWYLSKLLNRQTGKSFYDILNGIRVRKAKELLADPKLMIGQIAEMVGYADTAHFARTFKKLEGMSANEYRNILR